MYYVLDTPLAYTYITRVNLNRNLATLSIESSNHSLQAAKLIYMSYKSPDNELTVPDRISQEDLIKFWAISQLSPERKEIIIDVLKEFREPRKHKEDGNLTP